jgi:hypothetical protein
MGPHGIGFPNHGHDDHGWKMYITAVVMIVLSGLFVIARITTRFWMLGKLGWDDITIIVALVSDTHDHSPYSASTGVVLLVNYTGYLLIFRLRISSVNDTRSCRPPPLCFRP